MRLELPYRRQTKENHEAQFLINSMTMDEIEKKSIKK
jgi:hypothetical protein